MNNMPMDIIGDGDGERAIVEIENHIQSLER